MTQGTVKWFNSRKGYGFISVDGDNSEVFVHANDISGTDFRKELFENQVVEFEIGQGQKGPAAKNVKVVE